MSAQPSVEVIDDMMVLDAINDPLRWRIYNLVFTPKTVRDLSQFLGVRASRLYYHLHLLERHGWVRVTEERRTTAGTERLYGSGRGAFMLADSVYSQPGYNQDGWQIGVYQDLWSNFESNLDAALERGWPADGLRAMAQRFRRLPQARVTEMMDKVEAVINEYMGINDSAEMLDRDPGEDDVLYGLLFVCDPFVEPPAFLQQSSTSS